MSAKEMGLDNPWTILLYCLTGVGLIKPQKPQAFALWYKANTADVDAAWQTNVDDLQKKKKPILPSQCAAAFQSFKSKTYQLLPEVEKSAWQDLATEEHEATTKEFKEKLQVPISKELSDLQQHLEWLPSVVKPLMQMIGEATGCIVSVYVAGPQPADSGQLHIASFHGDKTLSSVKQNFIKAKCANFKYFVLPIYSTFLKKCYMVEMCREQALLVDMPTLESIRFAAEEEGVALHPVVREIFNVSRGSETITTTTPTTKSISKLKKPLRVPPVKKMNEMLKVAMANDALKTAMAGTAPAPEAGTVPVPE
ncbi:hypothetical protein ARMGADRAFT_1089446 [Armillaria gallica]|uniref:Uncharacterized protein n=1 Tax=Armillaria gallica TaxID=47427 RepID=A0A2H3CPM5_ARMGA|nr:hypothetical protein ARMGADRAFT_1089446 [Armillaria gallica]